MLYLRDGKKAIEYYDLAAKQNYSHAFLNLGMIYLNGEYIQRDMNQAVNYFQQAADRNNLQALYNLAHVYYLGKNGENDEEICHTND